MPLPHTDSPSAIRAFGLNYQTTIDYPGLQPAQISEYGDITIKPGEVPTRLDGTPVYGRFFQASSNQLLLTTNTIANFLIEDGQRITFQAKPHASTPVIGNLLFGWATGGLLLQRHTLALHASSLVTPMGAVALCGASGIGKSTLVGLMMARGFPVLDDNIAALSFAAADAVHVMPGLGSIRLYADSLSWLGYDATGLTPLRGQPSKYIVPLAPQLCAQSAAPLKKIFILRRGDSYAITPLRADEKIPALQAHSFMGRLAPGLGRLSSLFQHWLTLCKRVPMAYLNIPAAVAPTQFADELAQRWQQADFD